MEKELVKIGEKIKRIKTSRQSQHDIIKEVLSDILDLISNELKLRQKELSVTKSQVSKPLVNTGGKNLK